MPDFLSQKEILRSILAGLAFTMLLFWISIAFPLAGFFCTFFVPLPILFFRAKLGSLYARVIIIGSVLLMSLAGFSADTLIFFELLLLGWFMGEFFERRFSLERTVAYSCGAVLAAGVAGLVIYSFIKGVPFMVLISGYVEKNLELTIRLYEEMGVSQDYILAISRSKDAIVYAIVRALPGLLTVFMLLAAWMNLLMARPLFKRYGLVFPGFGPLAEWKAPEMFVWGVIAGGIMLLVPARPVKMLGINTLMVFLTIFFFQGIAIISYFFERKGLPRAIRGVLYSFIALQQLLMLLVAGLGFFDVWVDFRKLAKKPLK